jgi:hypothetical protein
MEHSDAIRLRAAEKYVLGELSTQLRDEYEEHYFACHECAIELKATVAFVDGSRTALCTENLVASRKPEAVPSIGGWFGWLRPAFAVPVFAALLLVLGYQNLVTIPHLKSASIASIAGFDGDLVSLIGANSRSESAKRIRVHGTKPAILELDVPSTGEFTNYVCQLQDEKGQSVYEDRISADVAKKTVHLIVPGGRLQSQKYSLVISGENAVKPGIPSQTEIDRLAFTVEILP